ncbi:hypothetical protein [Filimonas effusa]|uniref:Uncharacterized protein n=1 Tax=Filimonas effusa TaxID=2508721 RepID=A0A4Q1D9C3_9BACT|nr:hypothetical protein [Filimonas effusa]RXK85974.1 hypothetical protein ESB13_03955 [Filimonas effusa]
MAQEITIIMLIDIPAAIQQGTLDGNIYMVDNLKTEGSENEATGKLISAVNGTYWATGAQASEQLINWLPYSVSCLSPNLPRFYAQDRLEKTNDRLLGLLRSSSGQNQTMLLQDAVAAAPLTVPALSTVADKQGAPITNELPLMDVRGKFLTVNEVEPVLLKFSSDENGNEAVDISSLSYLAPQIYNITGEAVDKGVIYPAQYGSPAPIKGGWYWCASVNTYMIGTYSYTMHITLYKPEVNGTNVVWTPVNFTYDARIKVTSDVMRNGFTGAGLGMLPIV